MSSAEMEAFRSKQENSQTSLALMRKWGGVSRPLALLVGTFLAISIASANPYAQAMVQPVTVSHSCVLGGKSGNGTVFAAGSLLLPSHLLRPLHRGQTIVVIETSARRDHPGDSAGSLTGETRMTECLVLVLLHVFCPASPKQA